MTARTTQGPSRSDLAKIHIGKTQLGMSEEDYRAMLRSVAGVDSAKDLSAKGTAKVMAHLRRLGFKPTPVQPQGQRYSRPVTANDPQSTKARALWLYGAEVGAVRDASERALGHFAKRITGVDLLQFADGEQMEHVIEAIKALIVRKMPSVCDALARQLPEELLHCGEVVMARFEVVSRPNSYDAWWRYHDALKTAHQSIKCKPEAKTPHA